jgi:hypothetical protein
MAAINRTALVLVCALCLLGALASSADAVGEKYKYVGFASMSNPQVEGNRAWNQRFSDLTKALFDIKYSSFTRVANKLSLSGFRPKTLSITSEDGDEHMLRPHPDNYKAIDEFHEQVGAMGEVYLSGVCMANSANVLIFDEMPPQYKIDDFVADSMDLLDVRIYAYYKDSNTIGYDFLDLDKPVFKDYSRLKKMMHAKIIQVLEDVMVNQSSLDVSVDPGDGTPASAPASDW